MTTGLFIGRFQPFHKGHLHLIKKALEEVDTLLIGIGSAQEKNTKENPFSAEERKKMITSTLEEDQQAKCKLHFIPDFKDDVQWIQYVKEHFPSFEVVYLSDKETYGEQWVERCFKEFTIKKIHALDNINGRDIRKKIISHEEWECYVPRQVVEYLASLHGVDRIKKVCS